jgi:ABC-2 type transport system ATP-binding protein
VRFTSDVEDLGWLADVPGAESVQRSGRSVSVRGSGPLLAYTAAALVEHGIAPEDLRADHRTLEDAFLALTGSSEGLSS